MASPNPSLELVLEPAITPSGPLLWNVRQQQGEDAVVMNGKRSDMVRVMGETLRARLGEGRTVVAKVYGKDGAMEEHVQYNPDGTGKKLPLPAKAAEAFGRKCSTLGAPTAAAPAKKASAGKLLGELRTSIEAVTTAGKSARRKAEGVLKRAKAADLGNGASKSRDELVGLLEAALKQLDGAKTSRPKKEAAKKAGKAASGKPMTEYQTFFADRAPVLRSQGLDNKAVMARVGEEWSTLKAAGKVGQKPKPAKAVKEPKAAKPSKAVERPAKTTSAKASKTGGDGLESYQGFAARRLPALAEKHGHKEAMVKLGEEWQMEKAARRQTELTGQRPKSAPPAVTAPSVPKATAAKPASKAGAAGKTGRQGKPAALPDDPNVAQLAMFLKNRQTHAST